MLHYRQGRNSEQVKIRQKMQHGGDCKEHQHTSMEQYTNKLVTNMWTLRREEEEEEKINK